MKNTSLNTSAVAVVVGLAVLACADPALAQFAGGSTDAPFRQGMNTLLNWAFIAGVAIALGSFIMACVFLLMRNLMGFAGGVVGVVIGGSLMANASTVVASLTNLRSIL